MLFRSIMVSERYTNTYTKLYYCASTFFFIVLISKVKSSVNLPICLLKYIFKTSSNLVNNESLRSLFTYFHKINSYILIKICVQNW